MPKEESREGALGKGGGKADEPAKPKVGDEPLLGIEGYQKDWVNIIPKAAFSHLAHEIFERAAEETGVTEIESSAMEALQMAAEVHVALAINAAGQAAAHAGRRTVRARDFDSVKNILLTMESGSTGKDGSMAPAATEEEAEKLAEAAATSKRKRGGEEGLESGNEEGEEEG